MKDTPPWSATQRAVARPTTAAQSYGCSDCSAVGGRGAHGASDDLARCPLEVFRRRWREGWKTCGSPPVPDDSTRGVRRPHLARMSGGGREWHRRASCSGARPPATLLCATDTVSSRTSQAPGIVLSLFRPHQAMHAINSSLPPCSRFSPIVPPAPPSSLLLVKLMRVHRRHWSLLVAGRKRP